MPNTEVKLLNADGSWDFVPVRVGRCQATLKALALLRLVFFCLRFFSMEVKKTCFFNRKLVIYKDVIIIEMLNG
jgi:hypothetical protein